MTEFIFAGFGGQGVLTAGMLLARIGVARDKQVTWIPAYGMEMRGGTANCAVKVDDEEIASPFVLEPDVLVALNQPSVEKFMPRIKPGGLMVVDISNMEGQGFRTDIRVVRVPAVEICRRHDNPRGLNLAALGSLAGAMDLFDTPAFLDGITDYFKKYPQMRERNIAVFEEGLALGQAERA